MAVRTVVLQQYFNGSSLTLPVALVAVCMLENRYKIAIQSWHSIRTYSK